MPNKSQVRRLYSIAYAHNWSHSGVRELIKMNYGVDSSRDLTPEQCQLPPAKAGSFLAQIFMTKSACFWKQLLPPML